MKILVTGGAGFIGSNLVDYLSWKGHQVKSLDIEQRHKEVTNGFLGSEDREEEDFSPRIRLRQGFGETSSHEFFTNKKRTSHGATKPQRIFFEKIF